MTSTFTVRFQRLDADRNVLHRMDHDNIATVEQARASIDQDIHFAYALGVVSGSTPIEYPATGVVYLRATDSSSLQWLLIEKREVPDGTGTFIHERLVSYLPD